MTGMISENAELKGQQSRIMKALREAAAPSAPDFRNVAQSAIQHIGGTGNYFNNLNQLETQRLNAGVNAEQGIYKLMQDQIDQGDNEAAGLHKAITDIVGNDPKAYTQILQDLHNDPEPISARNAAPKVMKYAAARGIVPLSLRKEKAVISKLEQVNQPGSGDPAAVREYNYFKSLTPAEQKSYLSVKRASPEETLQKERFKEKGKAQADAEIKLATTVAEAQDATDLIDQLIIHPGLSSSIGAKGPTGGLLGFTFPGTDAADFKARLEQLQGKQFLAAYNTLKGGGQITEVEGKKAESAIARMQRSQSEAEFKKSALELREIIENAVNIARKAAEGDFRAAGPGKNIQDTSDEELLKILGY